MSRTFIPKRAFFSCLGCIYDREVSDRGPGARPEEGRIRAAEFQAWAGLLDRLPVALIASDTAGLVSHWNRHAEVLFGLPADKALGCDLRLLDRGLETDEPFHLLMERVLDGESLESEYAATRGDGSELDVRIVSTPLFSEAGDVVGMIELAVDLTQLNSRERAESLVALQAAARQLVSLTDEMLNVDGVDQGLPNLAVLSPREAEVLGLLRQGMRVATLATRLGIRERTVRNHVASILRKLGVHSQRELLERLANTAVAD